MGYKGEKGGIKDMTCKGEKGGIKDIVKGRRGESKTWRVGESKTWR